MADQLTLPAIQNIGLSDQSRLDLGALQRIQPQKKWVWIQNGQIKEVAGFFETLKYLFFRTFYDRELGSRVNSLVENLDLGATRLFEQLDQYRPELQNLFFKCLSHLNRHQFDRSKISFNGALEKILHPEFEAVRVPVRERTDHLTGKNFNELVEEARFALKLGVRPKLADSGCGGTFFIYGRNRDGRNLQTIGVFKPRDAGPHGKNNPRLKSKIKALFNTLFQPPGFNKEHLHYAEAGVSFIDRKLNLGVVPYTDIVELESPHFIGENKLKKGSFQVFVPAKVAVKHLPLFRICYYLPKFICRFLFENVPYFNRLVREAIPANFEKIALVDILGGNIDRNFGNWMLHGPLGIAIDHGSCFPEKHVKRGFNPLSRLKEHVYTRNCNLWTVLPSLNAPFSDELQGTIQGMAPHDWTEGLRAVMTDADDPSSLESFSSKMQGVKERAEVVKRMASQNASIVKIGKVKRQHQFDRILKKDSPALVALPASI